MTLIFVRVKANGIQDAEKPDSAVNMLTGGAAINSPARSELVATKIRSKQR
jgi:hypothetical protein